MDEKRVLGEKALSAVHSHGPVIVIAVLFLVFITLGGLLLSKLDLVLKYSRRGSDDRFTLEFSLWRGILRWKLEVPLVEVKKTVSKPDLSKKAFYPFWRRMVPSPAFKLKAELEDKSGVLLKESEISAALPGPAGLARAAVRLLKIYETYRGAIHSLVRRIKVLEFSWETEVAGRDPALTGILTGLAWAAKWAVLLPLSRWAGGWGGPLKINVRPGFGGGTPSTVLYCRLEVRFYAVMCAALIWIGNCLKNYLKRRPDGAANES